MSPLERRVSYVDADKDSDQCDEEVSDDQWSDAARILPEKIPNSLEFIH